MVHRAKELNSRKLVIVIFFHVRDGSVAFCSTELDMQHSELKESDVSKTLHFLQNKSTSFYYDPLLW